MFTRVLMVCTGNICRSPMAQGLLERRLRERGLSPLVESAGTSALVGRPAEPQAVELMAARGIDLTGHRARQLTPGLLRSFDLVLVMEAWQQREVERVDPSARGRVHRLGRMGNYDVPDPYGGDAQAFAQSLALIERGLGELEEIFWRTA